VQVGPVTLQATFLADSGDQATDRLTIQIGAVDTTIGVSAPTSAATSTKVPLTATVKSRSGSHIPTGKVTFVRSDGTTIGTATLDGSGIAGVTYLTPATAGTVTLRASYAGDANTTPSTSSNVSVRVTTTASTLTLTAPQTAVIGVPVKLSAKLSPVGASGTVDFSAGTRRLGTARIANGNAVLAWTPDALGTITITASYSGGIGLSGDTDTARVLVSQALKTDSITLDPEGSAAAWAPGAPVSMGNGTFVTLGVVTVSRLPVQLGIAGPCSLSGTTVTVKGVGGPCTLTASTKGGNGYAPVTHKYTIQTVIGTQTAHVIAPASGPYRHGQRLRLGRLRASTNIGQPMSWRVTKGGSRCYIVQTTAFYRLTLKKRGTCIVRGSSAGIPGQWAPFRVSRTYTIR
jgi:hypothetical protein